LDEVLATISKRLGESRQCIHPKALPDLLFHYTNSNGLLGILSSGRLWATNYRFLNDSSEIAYGVAVFEAVLQERVVQAQNDVIAIFLERTRITANPFDGMFDCYVSCFCERDDLLNQWRMYATSGGGFAMGLQTKQIGLRLGVRHQDQTFFLRKVIYSEATQRQLIAEVLDNTIAALRDATQGMSIADANTLIARCCRFVRAETADYFMCFKHPAFEVEQEWRLCHVIAPTQEAHVLFREGSYGLTPYVALDPTPMAGVHANKIPLARITHGPVKDPTNVRYALRQLLTAKGYAPTEIAGSTLPMRV
jgi:hypothetical protein